MKMWSAIIRASLTWAEEVSVKVTPHGWIERNYNQ